LLDYSADSFLDNDVADEIEYKPLKYGKNFPRLKQSMKEELLMKKIGEETLDSIAKCDMKLSKQEEMDIL